MSALCSPEGAGRQPRVWVLHDGKPGMASQALGLADATGLPYAEKALAVRAPWAWLPAQLWLGALRAVTHAGEALAPPWPDLVIGCGRNSAAPALAIKPSRLQPHRRRAGPGPAASGTAKSSTCWWCRRMTGCAAGRFVVTRGAVHRVTAARLAAELARFPALQNPARPVVSVLIGGANRAYHLDLDWLTHFADQLAAVLRRDGGTALITPSRRTGEAGIALLRERLVGLPATIWDGAGDNPYYAYLAAADAILVDRRIRCRWSVKPRRPGSRCTSSELPGGSRKFARFHQEMREAGITRPFGRRHRALELPACRTITARAGARHA